MQGVSINLFVKTVRKRKTNWRSVVSFRLFGKREFKYEYLFENRLNSVDWNEFMVEAPNYSFIEKILKKNSVIIVDLIYQNSLFKTVRNRNKEDYLVIAFEEVVLRRVIDDFKILSQENISQKYISK
jgi:hypothetical protein